MWGTCEFYKPTKWHVAIFVRHHLQYALGMFPFPPVTVCALCISNVAWRIEWLFRSSWLNEQSCVLVCVWVCVALRSRLTTITEESSENNGHFVRLYICRDHHIYGNWIAGPIRRTELIEFAANLGYVLALLSPIEWCVVTFWSRHPDIVRRPHPLCSFSIQLVRTQSTNRTLITQIKAWL